MDYDKIHCADSEILLFLETADESDIESLDGFFCQLLALYEPDPNGVSWENVLTQEWKVLADGASVNELFLQLGLDQTKDDKVCYISDISEVLSAWDKIKEIVKTEKRYFCDTTSISSLIDDDISVCFERDTSCFYRARVHRKNEQQFQPSEMGCPTEVEQITPGRANPRGIAYLYLCQDKQTPLYEVRPTYLDRVDIGEFHLNVERIKLLDFTQNIQIFNLFLEATESDFIDVVRRKLLFNVIGNDLSKPLHSYDTDIEYIPTQLICEYCKVQGFDGVIFNSSQKAGGVNVVLFYPESASCVDVSSYEINQIDICTNPPMKI